MTRARTFRAMAPLLALLLGLTLFAPAASAWPLSRQDAPPAPAEVGAGPPGDRAFALVGRTVYQPDGVQLYGYLNAILGLDPALLFLDAPRSVGNARFTYRGEVIDAETAVRADVTAVNGAGLLRVYLDEDAGASPGMILPPSPPARSSPSSRSSCGTACSGRPPAWASPSATSG